MSCLEEQKKRTNRNIDRHLSSKIEDNSGGQKKRGVPLQRQKAASSQEACLHIKLTRGGTENKNTNGKMNHNKSTLINAKNIRSGTAREIR